MPASTIWRGSTGMVRRPPASVGDYSDKGLTAAIGARCEDGAHEWLADATARCCARCGLFQWRKDVPYEHLIDSPAPGGALDALHCIRGHEWAKHERFQRRPPPRSGYLRYCAACKTERYHARKAKAGR